MVMGRRATDPSYVLLTVGHRRLPFQASLATPVLVYPSCILWHLGDVLEREWLSRRLIRRLEMLCHLSRRSLCHRMHTMVQALTWWSSEWETTFQSRPLRQILWQEFVVSFERAFCPTYVRTKRLYQFLDLQQRDFTVVHYRARFVELGRYGPEIMADEGLRTQQFVRGLRPELRQALIVAHVTDLDAAYQTVAALEVDTLRTRARSAEVQTQVVPTQPRQQQGSVQTTPRIATSYASTSTGTTAKSGSRRKFRRDRRQAEQRQQLVGSVQQPVGQPSQQEPRTFAGQCYRCDQMGHMARDCPLLPRTQSQPRVQQQQQAPVQQRQQTRGSGGSRGRGRVSHLTRADAEAAQLVEGTVTVFGYTARVLFDFGASHSFVSEEFLDSLGELSSGESVELAVELPTGDFVLTSYFLEE
ncbi:hypothetical protein Taro_052173, partial [Colocasia esculenta]|nr:hypothetical protein [Colocasia esculenta]